MRRVHVSVVACVGLVLLCAGLLFPAVMRVREAAARMSCAGNFCYLGVALHSYAETHGGAFPTGTRPHPVLPAEQRLSWIVALLPHIDQDREFRQFDLARGPREPENATATANRFRTLVCPSSDEYASSNGFERKWKSPYPLTHRIGVAGVGPDAAALPEKHPRAGVFGCDRRTALSDGIPDGASNTLMLAETAHEPGHWAHGGAATVRAFDPSAQPYIGPARPFGGFHSGQFVVFGTRERLGTFGFADGSYRTLSHSTAPEVLEALATVAGREQLPADW